MPRSHRMLASFAAAFLVVAAGWLVPGCGSEPQYDRSTQYTPGALAQELVFQTRSLSPEARKAVKDRSTPANKTKAAPGYIPEPETKGESKAQTKQAQTETLDSVLDDVERKARAITTIPAPEVFKQIAEAVSKDTTLDAKDRDTLVERLNQMAKAG